MASQNNDDELHKVSKKLFAPPFTKPSPPFAKGKPALHRKQEEVQANPVPLNRPAGNGSAAKPIKARYPKVNTKGQDKKQEGSTKVEKEAEHKKDRDITKNVIGKEDDCLNNSVFEEIVESVLKKSLEECMENFKKIAPSPEEQALGKEIVEASPPTREDVSGKANRDKGEVMLVEAEQQEPRLEKRRHSKLSVKDKNENPEADNGGRKENRKGAPKKKVQGDAQILHQEEKQEEGEEEATDEGSCNSLPSKYHVTFFGDSVSRAWISASMLRNFGKPNAEGNCLAKPKIKDDKKNLERAQKMAREAEQMSIPERIRTFGFCSRFSGKDRKDLNNLTCRPHVEKSQGPGGRNENTGTSNKSQDQLLLETPVVGPDGKLKKKTCVKRGKKSVLEAESSPLLSKRSRRRAAPPKAAAESKARDHQDDLKGPKMSFVVPRCKDAEAKQPSSCADCSNANLLLSGHPSKKDRLSEAGISQVAGNNLVLNKVTVSHEEPDELRVFGDEEEEIFGSQEMALFAEEKDSSPEDFSLALFEE